MSTEFKPCRILLSCEDSRALDRKAHTEWGFNTFSLIEAAGRSCAQVFTEAFPQFFTNAFFTKRITVAAGTGNNGADAMLMLRYWLITGLTDVSRSKLVLKRKPKDNEKGPWVDLIKSLEKMKVKIVIWEGEVSSQAFAQSDIIIDGISGTGLSGPLEGAACEMLKAINSLGEEGMETRPFVVSVDLPSGLSDNWEPGMPIIKADLSLVIEPQKYCVYMPSARPYSGIILPVSGVFPKEIIAEYSGAELINWDHASQMIPGIRPEAYKNERGLVEIHAGSVGTTGAALIAARGAQAAGAGLVRLIVDNDIHPILASQSSGVMVIPSGHYNLKATGQDSTPDAILLGPGWGSTPDRLQAFENALASEKEGTPLILDADAIDLAKGRIFNGKTILTPHPMELSRLTGIDKEELLRRPAPILLNFARKCNALILFKGHVITIVSPDGRLGVLDGMCPGLAAGGSGDLLAGFCVAIAARMKRSNQGFDAYTCASSAAALLIASGKSEKLKARFTDPLELADKAADLAGESWLKFS